MFTGVKKKGDHLWLVISETTANANHKPLRRTHFNFAENAATLACTLRTPTNGSGSLVLALSLISDAFPFTPSWAGSLALLRCHVDFAIYGYYSVTNIAEALGQKYLVFILASMASLIFYLMMFVNLTLSCESYSIICNWVT